jgi:hypothetical protein
MLIINNRISVLDEKVDHIQTQKILCARSRILGKDIQKARRLAAAHNLVNSAKNIAAMAVTPVEPVVIPVILICMYILICIYIYVHIFV